MFIPSLIVIFWKRRPVVAVIIATLIAFLTLTVPGIFLTFQAMTKYGISDPQVMAGGIVKSIIIGLLNLFYGIPILLCIQWFARRRYKRNKDLTSSAETFN